MQRKTKQGARRRGRTWPRAAAKLILPVEPGRRGPARQVPRRWGWHYATLVSLRERLLRDRGALLNEAAQPLEPHSMDEADSATDELNHDLALSILSAEQDALYEVDQALRRIFEGNYGQCEETGEPIPAARLKAIPWTRFSRAVEERLERKEQVPRAHLGQVGSIRGAVTGNLEPIESEVETEGEPSKDEQLTRVRVQPAPSPRAPIPGTKPHTKRHPRRKKGHS